jgi:N-acetyl-anhydromuramyl-L-alanine amidase AmpD
MKQDYSYLNRTKNKWWRFVKPEFVVWHETDSPNPNNPYGTLDYNINNPPGSSYHYLVSRAGVLFHYLNPVVWIAAHAGESYARGHRDWQVSVHSIGVEIDGGCDGTPATPAQMYASVWLMYYFRDTFGIPINRGYHLGHKEIAPGRKHDPQAYNLDQVVALAQSVTRYQVNVETANVRAGTDRSAAVLEKESKGAFIYGLKEVVGESIGGNDRWVKRPDGLYVHTSVVTRA